MITSGAEPLLLLDYVAANRIDLEQVAELVEGAAEVCRAAGCALIGGETAELPGVYREDELDFAGTCVGVVERDALLDGSQRRGRRRRRRLPVGRRARERLHARPADPRGGRLRRRRPARADAALPRRRAPRCARGAHAFAHVTGGGIAGNLARVVPDGLRAAIDWDAWERPPVFEWLARHVDEDELRRVFNLGIGYCAVVAGAGRGDLVIGRIERDVIGVLVSGEGTNLQALIDAGLPIVAVASNKPDARGARARASARASRPRSFDARPTTRRARSATSRSPTGSRRTASSSSCCAGYMHLLPHAVPRPLRRPDRQHRTPSPLPEFPGAHPIEDALAAGVAETGVDRPLVDEGIDTGPGASGQEPVPVEHARDARAARPGRRAPAAAARW